VPARNGDAPPQVVDERCYDARDGRTVGPAREARPEKEWAMPRSFIPLALAFMAFACTSSASRAVLQAQEGGRSVGLSAGCNMVTLVFPSGSDAAAAASAVTPPDALDTIWRLDNATHSFQAYATAAPAASDLRSLNPLDAVFVCLHAPASITMPAASPDPSGGSMSISLFSGCNALGLTFPDGTTASEVAEAISPAGVFESMWRLDNASGVFQAYSAAAPEVSDLTSLQFLDAAFVCVDGPASLPMPALTGYAATPPAPRAAGEPTCQIFPSDNPWNTDVSGLPVDPRSDAYIDAIGRDDSAHPDFGTVWEGEPNGIPYVVVSGGQPRVPVTFYYAEDSDPGPYPIPPNAPIEGGPDSTGDRHVIVLDDDNCMLYELWDAHPINGGESWSAGSGAIFDLSSNGLRPDFLTSADAAGLPIFPGLVRYQETVVEGVIDHALRFTVEDTQRAFIHPATHFASDNTDPNLPPMGLRLRMKADYDCSGLSREVQVICAALKRYGMFVADNGGNWFISGAPDDRWNDDDLADLGEITGDAFEVVDTGEPIVTE
jgi:hypothetical protein